MASLDTLLPEIQFSIISHLSPVPEQSSPEPNALLSLSLVSRRLNIATESFSNHLLKRLHHRFPSTSPAPAINPNSASAESHRGTYLRHSRSHCFLCDTASLDRTSRSKLTDLPCCAPCTIFLWPYNIGSFEASLIYLLDEASLIYLANKGRPKRGLRDLVVTLDEREVRRRALLIHAEAARGAEAEERTRMAHRFLVRVEWIVEVEKLLDTYSRIWVAGRRVVLQERKADIVALVKIYVSEPVMEKNESGAKMDSSD